MNDEFTTVNNKAHTIESMLKDVKNQLNNLEILLNKVEKSEVFDKESIFIINKQERKYF